MNFSWAREMEISASSGFKTSMATPRLFSMAFRMQSSSERAFSFCWAKDDVAKNKIRNAKIPIVRFDISILLDMN
ncbi:hypothetical protein ES703_116751 [subsurface metagenome]